MVEFLKYLLNHKRNKFLSFPDLSYLEGPVPIHIHKKHTNLKLKEP